MSSKMKTFSEFISEGQHFLRSVGKNDTIIKDDNDAYKTETLIGEIVNTLGKNAMYTQTIVLFLYDGYYHDYEFRSDDAYNCTLELSSNNANANVNDIIDSYGGYTAADFINLLASKKFIEFTIDGNVIDYGSMYTERTETTDTIIIELYD